VKTSQRQSTFKFVRPKILRRGSRGEGDGVISLWLGAQNWEAWNLNDFIIFMRTA